MLRRGLFLLVVVMVTLSFVAISRAAPINHVAPATSIPPVVLTQFPVVVVVKSSANVRSGPGTEYTVISGARPGQRLNVLGCNADCSWYRLANDCWIAAFLVKPELPPTVVVSIPITIAGQPTQCPQTISPTTTYAGPGTFYPTVDVRPAGECVAIIGRNAAGDWYQLFHGMWIDAAAVIYAEPIETIPVTDGIFTATPVPPPTPMPTATPTITPTVAIIELMTVGEWTAASQSQKEATALIWTQRFISEGSPISDPALFAGELLACVDNTLRGTAEILGPDYPAQEIANGCILVLR